MPLPLTLLCTPTTALRDETVRQLLAHRPGLVVVVHDMDELLTLSRVRRRVLDATGTLEDETFDLEHGCVSCTLREDVLPTLVRVSMVGRWREVVLALPAPVLPEGVIDVVRWGRVDGDDVAEHVALDSVCTVVDALSLVDRLSGDELLSELGLAAAETDGRTLAELTACQLEQADVVALRHLEHVGAERARTVESLVAHVAPLAIRVPVTPDGGGAQGLVSTGRAGQASTQERARLVVMAHEMIAPDAGVSTLVWRSDRPLDPVRLHEALEQVVEPVQRGRGHVQLANRPKQVLLWECAGAQVSMGVLEQAPQAGACCELVLTGVGLDVEQLRRHLDGCVVTDAELGRPNDTDPDPFRDALGAPEPLTDPA